MDLAWPWAFLVLYLPRFASGRPRLAPPQNVMLLSRDFSVYLTWLPGPGNPQNVTYSVKYSSLAEHQKWRKVERCQRTTALHCDLTCLESLDMYIKFRARVLAISDSSRSHWVESKFLDYIYEVEPAPPVLLVTQTDEFLIINATYQLPSCMLQLQKLDYQLAFWKEGTENKTLFPVTSYDTALRIPLQPLVKGNYCVNAKTVYTSSDIKYSNFSRPICFLLKDPGSSWVFLLLLLLPVVLSVMAAGCVLWKRFTRDLWSEKAKMPQPLDFSVHRSTVATLSLNSLESLDNLILCPQKELRVRLNAQDRSLVDIQAWTENCNAKGNEDEEVTDEDDDSISFQPYIAPPPLLEHSVPEGRGTPPDPADKTPDWDSSSSSWTRTESSGYLSKEGSGQRLGLEESPWPLLLPKVSDSDSLESDPLKDNPASWLNWGSLLPGWTLDPEESQVCLHTLNICSNSSTGVTEEEEEEESGMDSDSEDCGASSWGVERPQETEARGLTLGHYMAR